MYQLFLEGHFHNKVSSHTNASQTVQLTDEEDSDAGSN